MNIVDIDRLVVDFAVRGSRRQLRAVEDVSIAISEHETVGLVGESGSGKSTIGRALLGLAPVTSGSIRFKGDEIAGIPAEKRPESARGIQVVFQDPYGSLNPSRTVGQSIAEPAERVLSASMVKARVAELISAVRLPKDSASRYPHAFSGGQRQRIAIARALSSRPELMVCDEAISALDVVTQAEVMNMLHQLQRETGVAMLFIAHNLPLVAHIAHRVVVLYRGRVMEQGPSQAVHRKPLHPYTRVLVGSVPVPNQKMQRARREQQRAEGLVSSVDAGEPGPHGCPFAPRCPAAQAVCSTVRPSEVAVGEHSVTCHAYDPASGHTGAGVL